MGKTPRRPRVRRKFGADAWSPAPAAPEVESANQHTPKSSCRLSGNGLFIGHSASSKSNDSKGSTLSPGRRLHQKFKKEVTRISQKIRDPSSDGGSDGPENPKEVVLKRLSQSNP